MDLKQPFKQVYENEVAGLKAYGEELLAKKLLQRYLPAIYPNPNNAVTRALDHKKPAV